MGFFNGNKRNAEGEWEKYAYILAIIMAELYRIEFNKYLNLIAPLISFKIWNCVLLILIYYTRYNLYIYDIEGKTDN